MACGSSRSAATRDPGAASLLGREFCPPDHACAWSARRRGGSLRPSPAHSWWTDQPEPPTSRRHRRLRHQELSNVPAASQRAVCPRVSYCECGEACGQGRAARSRSFRPRRTSWVPASATPVPGTTSSAFRSCSMDRGSMQANGRVHGEATLADIAPTVATWLDFPFEAPDGHELVEATQEDQVPAPRLIVTLVWDGGGRDVLDRWPDDWPFLASLVERGTWYEDATVGSSPTNTPPSHATMGSRSLPSNQWRCRPLPRGGRRDREAVGRWTGHAAPADTGRLLFRPRDGQRAEGRPRSYAGGPYTGTDRGLRSDLAGRGSRRRRVA